MRGMQVSMAVFPPNVIYKNRQEQDSGHSQSLLTFPTRSCKHSDHINPTESQVRIWMQDNPRCVTARQTGVSFIHCLGTVCMCVCEIHISLLSMHNTYMTFLYNMKRSLTAAVKRGRHSPSLCDVTCSHLRVDIRWTEVTYLLYLMS